MRKRQILLVLGALLFLGSCATVTSIIERVPRWTIRTPSATLTTLSFVAEGSAQPADAVDAARDEALDDLMYQLSEYVGYRLEEGHRRELFQNYNISDLSITVVEEFHQTTEDDTVKVFILAEANRKTINDFRRAQEERRAREGQEHLSFRDSARRAYARNQDIQAVEHYLDAAGSAYQARIPENLDLAKEYLQQAISIVEGLRVVVQTKEVDTRTFQVRVVREGRAFSSGAAEAAVVFYYPVYNAAGKQIQLEQKQISDSRGYASLRITHPGFRGSGRITANIHISDVHSRVESLREDPELDALVSKLFRITSEKQVGISFSVLPEMLRGNVGAAILEYDRGGDQRERSNSLDTLMEIFSQDDISISEMPIMPVSSEQQALEYLREQSGGQFTAGIVGSVEIISVVTSGQRIVATAQGKAQLVEAATLNVRANTNTVVANGIGSTTEEAKQKAFNRFGEITASILLTNL